MKRAIVAASVLAVSLLGMVPAQASGTVTTKLHLFSSGTGNLSWVRHSDDSPLDGNHSALSTAVGVQDGNDYTVAYTHPSVLGSGVPIEDMRNLSYDFKNTMYQGAGAPRISVDLSDGFDAFLSGGHCAERLVEDNTWSRADFTGRVTTGCDIYTSNPSFPGPYSSDGTHSAWAAFVAAYPSGTMATDAYVVQDETGSALLDRVAIYDRMWTKQGKAGIVRCKNESAC